MRASQGLWVNSLKELGSKWLLGSNSAFLWEHSKNILGNKENFENVSGEHGNTDPSGVAS